MRNMIRRFFSLILALSMCGSLLACGANVVRRDTVPFTDSCGRVVEVPSGIEKLAVSGSMAQIIVFALSPDKLVGIASPWSEEALAYLPEKYAHLPVLGQLHGGQGDLNPETLLQSGAQLIIDIGENKDGLREDLDALQAQIGLPIVHLDAQLSSFDKTFTLLGELLGLECEAATLSAYCRSVYDRAVSIAAQVNKVRALYLLGDDGCHVLARHSYHAQVMDLLCENIALIDAPSSRGTGNETDLEQILLWNPDYIFFAPESNLSAITADPVWQSIPAIRDRHYCQVPAIPFNWMGFPPSAQRLLGMIWTAYVLYPDVCGYDLYSETAQFFELFYHVDLSREQFEQLLANTSL